MPVSVTVPGGEQKVIIEVGQQLKSLGAETTLLTGGEQTLCEQPGGSPSQVMGYVDLSNLAHGDVVAIRFYVKVKENSAWGLCYEESYSDSLTPPVVHIAKRPENNGLKVTIQQTAGSPKSIDYEFYEES